MGRGHLSEVTQDNQGFMGLNVWEISDLLNQDPVDVVFDLLVEGDASAAWLPSPATRPGECSPGDAPENDRNPMVPSTLLGERYFP